MTRSWALLDILLEIIEANCFTNCPVKGLFDLKETLEFILIGAWPRNYGFVVSGDSLIKTKALAPWILRARIWNSVDIVILAWPRSQINTLHQGTFWCLRYESTRSPPELIIWEVFSNAWSTFSSGHTLPLSFWNSDAGTGCPMDVILVVVASWTCSVRARTVLPLVGQLANVTDFDALGNYCVSSPNSCVDRLGSYGMFVYLVLTWARR